MGDILNHSGNGVESLTEREQEILACLVSGLSNQDIAARLHLAHRTVRWYNSQIYSKLGVNTREAAVAQVQALGLLTAEQDSPAQAIRNNLPVQMTPFIGRQHELADIARLLADPAVRLITILAPGGMGKTRLGVAAAERQLRRFTDGVFFVPLAPLSHVNDIVTAIADNIGFSFYGENSPQQQLIDFLKDRAMLLVLDNFEHLIDGAPLVADMVRTATQVKVLTTSRERLNLHSETVYALRGFDFSTWETPEDALVSDAVRLFMQSAHRVRPDFELQAHDLAYLARICRLTGGMPLGIELAAGWVDVLSLEQIAAEIQQGIDILETDMRDVPERQRSIRATFEHTWRRLKDEERTIFGRLSIFRGGFTMEAAQAIAGATVRDLRKLVDKALVQAPTSERYEVHELLRQFGAERLAESDDQTRVQSRHATFFAHFMAARKFDIKTNRQLEALALIDPDFENVRLAWLYTVNQQKWETLPSFLHSLWFYLDLRTRDRDGVDLFEEAVKALRAVPASDITELALGRVLARLGWCYYDIGMPETGVMVCDEAIHLLRRHNSPEDLIAALYSRQMNALIWNQFEVAFTTLQEALDVARTIGDRSWEGHLLLWLAISLNLQNNFAAGLPFVEEAKSIFEALGDRAGFMRVYELLGIIHEDQTHYGQAREWFQKALVLAEAFGDRFEIAQQNANMARIPLRERDFATARSYLKRSLKLYWDAGYKWAAPLPIAYMAQMFVSQGERESAVETLATIYKHQLSYKRTDQIAQALRDELQTRLEADRFDAAWMRGQQRELSTLVAELLAEN